MYIKVLISILDRIYSMTILTDLTLKFEQAYYDKNPEFGLMDTILEQHPELLDIVVNDIINNTKRNNFVKGDAQIVEQIMRATIYKELKSIDY